MSDRALFFLAWYLGVAVVAFVCNGVQLYADDELTTQSLGDGAALVLAWPLIVAFILAIAPVALALELKDRFAARPAETKETQ